jgi:hypothetical protein
MNLLISRKLAFFINIKPLFDLQTSHSLVSIS